MIDSIPYVNEFFFKSMLRLTWSGETTINLHGEKVRSHTNKNHKLSKKNLHSLLLSLWITSVSCSMLFETPNCSRHRNSMKTRNTFFYMRHRHTSPVTYYLPTPACWCGLTRKEHTQLYYYRFYDILFFWKLNSQFFLYLTKLNKVILYLKIVLHNIYTIYFSFSFYFHHKETTKL